MSSPTLSNILFIDCEAVENGGGIDCGNGSPVVKNCVFINNVAGTGGGICAQGPAIISNCIFIGCSVDHAEYHGHGGGFAVTGSASASITNCIFIGGTSENLGGGLFVDEGCSLSVVHCTLFANRAETGSGLYVSESGQAAVANSIVAFGETSAAVDGAGVVEMTHCNVFGHAEGDWTGPIAGQLESSGNISAEPLFVDAENSDLHLCHDSPCRNSGDNTISNLPQFDMEDDPRITDETVDMGADEFHPHLYLTGEKSPGGAVEAKLVGSPGTYHSGLWFGLAGLLDLPIQTNYGPWYLNYPWIEVWPLPVIPTNGVLVIPATLPAYSAPYDLPMQALVGVRPGIVTNVCLLQVRDT